MVVKVRAFFDGALCKRDRRTGWGCIFERKADGWVEIVSIISPFSGLLFKK
jgi:hypothetical protein